jgi:PAS domain S-box-containing protein
MLSPKGERRSTEEKVLRVVYVGEGTREAAVAEQLAGAERAAETERTAENKPAADAEQVVQTEAAVETEQPAEAEQVVEAAVEQVDRGAEALDYLETTGVDCVVAEADLPDADGAELLSAVGELYPAVARVLLADSVEKAPADVEFVPPRARAGLPARGARRGARAVPRLTTARERDRLADRAEGLTDRFATLVEESPDPILTVDEAGRVVFANEAIERVFGVGPASVVGEPVLELLDEGVHDCFEETIEELVEDEGMVHRDYVELPGEHADGREVPLAISFNETERDGRTYFSAIVRDVSERKRLEENLEAEKRKTRELHEVAVMLEACDTPEEVCRLAVETAEQLLEFDLAAVDVVEDGELVPQAVSKGVPTDGYYTTTPLDADDNLAARAYRQGKSLRTANLHDEGVNPAASGYRAALSVPMGDIGVFQAVSEETDAFRESDRELAELLTSHVTQALKRTRSEEALKAEKRKIKELHEVAVMLEACDTAQEVSELAVETAEELLEFDRCVLGIREDGEYVPVAVSEDMASDEYYSASAEDENSLAVRAIRRGESIETADLREENLDAPLDEYRAVLTVPVGGIGVFQALSKEVGVFDESDRELAELLTSHVAQALQRIRSERKLEAERDRFAALFENTRDAIVYYEMEDGEPVFRAVNDAFEEVFGYHGDEVHGQSVLDHEMVPDDKRVEVERLTQRVRNDEQIDAEVEWKTADGMRDFLLRTASVSSGGGGYAIFTDITERKRSEERHRSMTEDVLDNTDVGIFVLDDEFEVAWMNATVEDYFGLDRESVVGTDKAALVENRVKHAVEDPESFAETLLRTYEDNSFVEEFTCHVTPGEGRVERHLQHRSRPIESGLYAGGRVELYYDVTERTEREEMLDALHGASRKLMTANDQRAICETAVETARGVLDLPHAMVFKWNPETERLESFIHPEDTTEMVGPPPRFERGEGLIGSAFDDGEARVYQDAQQESGAMDDESDTIRGLGVFPLGDWGVLSVASLSKNPFDGYEIDLAKVLAANTEVAINRAAREAELAEQRSQLAELDRINEVIRDVDQLLVRASTREEIVQAVCDRLADSAHYRFAWTGEAAAGSKRVRPTASAGVEDGYLDAVTVTYDEADEHGNGPAGAAIRSGEVQVVQNVPEAHAFESWRDEAVERGYRSVAAIPLRYRETVYGVLCVYAERANAFDAREQAVLAELGETIGHAINAAKNKRALLSDGVVEVELETDGGEGFFARVPQEEGGEFELEGVTMTAEGSFVYFMTVDGLDPDCVLALADDADDVEQARLVNEHDDGHLFEFVYTGPSPLQGLADHAGTLKDARFTEHGGRSVVELPQNVDVRPVVESIQDAIPDSEVVARRERERPARTVEEFRTTLEDDLTERQRSALEAAFYAGFFEWPRESNGEEVSESLGVSAPTFHQHLRVGERKLLSAFLDE